MFWAVEGGFQVEVANVKRGEPDAGAREDAVENELGKFKGCCRGANVARKGDAISSDGDECAVGIAFLWADLANHFGVSEFCYAVGWDIFEADEEEGVVPLTRLPVPSGEVPIPWQRRLISLEYELLQTLWKSGCCH